MENNNKVLSFLGLLYRGRGVSFGDVLLSDIKTRKISLVIYAKDSGESVRKKLLDKCSFYKIENIELFSKEELGLALGKSQLSAIGIIDYKASKKIKDSLKKEDANYEK